MLAVCFFCGIGETTKKGNFVETFRKGLYKGGLLFVLMSFQTLLLNIFSVVPYR